MITPKEISAKASRKVHTFLAAKLKGEPFEPWLVRFGSPKEVDLSWKQTDQWIQNLRAHSKESIGYGYRIEFKIRRFHGSNSIPERIIFDTAEDVFRSAGRHTEAQQAINSFKLLTSRFPVLNDWCLTNIATLIGSNKEFLSILKILDAYLEYPRPNIFRREFAAAPHSKYLEDHEKLIAELLGHVAAEHVDQCRTNFDARYGFKRLPRTCWVRFLDPKYIPKGIPGEWIALPYETLAQMSLPPKLLISENRTPLLSLPQYKGTLGIWGEGGAVSPLAQQSWVNQRKVFYWGDLDCHGLAIYGKFKEQSPNTLSVLMEDMLLETFKELVGTYAGAIPSIPDSLTSKEMALFSHVVENELRLEQERIPHKYVLNSLQEYGFEQALPSAQGI